MQPCPTSLVYHLYSRFRGYGLLLRRGKKESTTARRKRVERNAARARKIHKNIMKRSELVAPVFASITPAHSARLARVCRK